MYWEFNDARVPFGHGKPFQNWKSHLIRYLRNNGNNSWKECSLPHTLRIDRFKEHFLPR